MILRRSVALLIIVTFAASFSLLIGCKKKEQHAKVSGNDFVLNDVNGVPVRLSDHRGKVVLLEFWATWCPPCRMAIPDLNALEERFNGKDFKLLAISINEPRDKVKTFSEDNNISYTVLVDDQEVNHKYGVRNIPTTFILDKEGNIVTKHLGYSPDFLEITSQEIENHL